MKLTTTLDRVKKMSDRWAPLSTELSLRKYIIHMTRGAWKKKHQKKIDAVAYQRIMRGEDRVRDKRLNALWQKGRTKRTSKKS